MRNVPVRFRWMTILLLFVLLLGGVAAPEAGAGSEEGRLHWYLAKQASPSNSNWVDVIVAVSPTASTREIERAVGGKVVRKWAFINAALVSVQANRLKDLSSTAGVKFVSPDAATNATTTYDPGRLVSRYQEALKIKKFWDHNYLGAGIGVAVIDSGVAAVPSLAGRVVNVVLPTIGDWQDYYGHGTHVAGIIAADSGDGLHAGVAPQAKIFNVRVTDANGDARESDVLSGLEWVYNNARANKIRVVNISLQSGVANSYKTSPLAAAVEKLWFSGVVVVVSSGNRGDLENTALYPPANDPYVITVGAMDDRGTSGTGDDVVVGWSSQGRTQTGLTKPDILAPGRRILAPASPNSRLARDLASLVQEGHYISLSGSSMAAPTISGAVALMVQVRPSITPDQVKWVLTYYRREVEGQYNGGPAVPKFDNIYDNLLKTLKSANQGLTPSIFLSEDPTLYQDAISLMNVYYDNVYYTNIDRTPVYFGD